MHQISDGSFIAIVLDANAEDAYGDRTPHVVQSNPQGVRLFDHNAAFGYTTHTPRSVIRRRDQCVTRHYRQWYLIGHSLQLGCVFKLF